MAGRSLDRIPRSGDLFLSVLMVLVLGAIFFLVGCADSPVLTETAGTEPVAEGGRDGVVEVLGPTPNPASTIRISSEILGEDRRVYIQLPDGYEGSNRRYPVLVILDGEWLFETARSTTRFFSEYRAMDINMPPMIILGIENTDRDHDYVPTEDPKEDPDFPTAGRADDFLDFLDRELFPYVDRTYRTATSRTIVGWSFGGLFAMYSAVARPELFDGYLCVSPAIWWDSDLIYELYHDVSFERPKRMVITLGSYEEGGSVATSTKRILSRFAEDPVQGLQLTHFEFERVGHSWGIPAAFDKGLRQLFAVYLPPDSVVAHGEEEVTRYYRDLSESWGFEVDPPAPVMISLALSKEEEGDREHAIEILDRLLEYEPDLSMAWFHRGRFNAQLGDEVQARIDYERALAAELKKDVPSGVYLRLFRERLGA